MLYRGGHPLPHQCQLIQRDLHAEQILQAIKAGKTRAFGYRRTAEQIADDRNIPYEYLVYSPASAALSWTAFFTRDHLQVWLEAYGCTIDTEPEPGGRFFVQLPASEAEFAELHDDATPYDPRRSY